MEDNDAQSQLKKRARRRLVGAVAFASVVAVVLPMVMDHEPRQAVQEVEIRIPGQDEKLVAPKLVMPPAEKPALKASEPVAESKPAAAAEVAPGTKPTTRVLETAKDKPPEKATEKASEKQPEKTVEKAPQKVAEKPPAKPEKTPEKASEKPAEKPAAKDTEAKRAAAILAGQASQPETAAAPAKSGEFVILIGAFANEDNVRNLKSKLAEKNIKTYSEPLQTPNGAKTRVRAGPFPNREAADKALEKMKQIGVSGVISGK